jgi:hypothetical protein
MAAHQAPKGMSERGGVALVALLALAGCAATPAGRYDQKAVREHAMSPYVIHEACLRMAVGERVEYYFTSTFPIDFNIHYHEGNAVVMPISRDKASEDSGVFTARIAHDYCVMWEAGATGATIDYGIRLRPPAAP